jgi:hypothetical protein
MLDQYRKYLTDKVGPTPVFQAKGSLQDQAQQIIRWVQWSERKKMLDALNAWVDNRSQLASASTDTPRAPLPPPLELTAGRPPSAGL